MKESGNADSVDLLTTKNNFANILKRNCLDAKELHECNQKRKHEMETLKRVHSKRIKFYNCEDFEPKLGNYIQELATIVNNLESKIQFNESAIIENVLDHIRPLYDTKEILKQLKLPTKNDIEQTMKVDSFEIQNEKLVERLTPLFSNKLDASEKMDFEASLKEAKEYLMNYFKETEDKSEKECKELIESVEKISKETEMLVDGNKLDQLAKDISRKMLGLPIFEKEENEFEKFDIQWLAQDALRSLFGKQLVYQITNGKSDENVIYPIDPNHTKSLQAKDLARIRKNHQQRSKIKASLATIDKIEKETNEDLLKFENNLFSDPLQRLCNNLNHIDTITENHQKVLEYINAPEGESDVDRSSLPDEVKDYIPPFINLYKRDYRLSEALARTITRYTDLYYFSDLRKQIDALEKKL
ncbi:MAG: hypothetical protein EXX96DRAFT_588084 [Benjaminiella poitrasii]|nr:MAG: hypothetical protein EXX96DRAFT_588084 [Benjaminiella poitrasii]